MGKLFAIDIQAEAIANTKKRLMQALSPACYQRVAFIQESHRSFPIPLTPHSVKLIVYNLGYLPGGNKELTTRVESTQASLLAAQELITIGGIISVTCYPGHPEGKREQTALLEQVALLNPQEWVCRHHQWINRVNAPSLLLICRI
jgi:hypothetical protein